MSRFAGKVVLITGAASGFGLMVAQDLAAQEARLSLSDIAPDGIDIPDAMISKVDVSQEADIAGQVADTLDRFGQLDIAINNAGIGGRMAPITETTVEEFDQLMAVNARGVFLGLKHQLPPMLAAGSGAIVNVSSASGLVGAAAIASYAAAKHAVIGLTRSAADEVARRNVRVNAVCPSFADTPLFNAMADDMAARYDTDRSGAYDRITRRIPMRRVAKVSEVTQAILWACDPANSFMTGQAISIDGGLTAI
ncbi:SDR family NAD(P)-dependent oxidoreductase [Halovulum sp. GXIMD14793]